MIPESSDKTEGSELDCVLARSQEERDAEWSLSYQEKLELEESLRAATQAVDEKNEEIAKMRSALAQAEKDSEHSQRQWERDRLRLLEEHRQETSRLIAALIRSQEQLEIERGLWNRWVSQWEIDESRLHEVHLQVTSSLTARLARSEEQLEAERSLWNQEKVELQESLTAATQAVDEEKKKISKDRSELAQTVKNAENSQRQWECERSRLLEEHLQVTSSLTARLTSYQEGLEAERRLCYQEKLDVQESIRAVIQAADEEEEENSKVRSALARLQEEHLQVTSSLTAALTSSQEELEAERSLWNQEKLNIQESLRAAIQAAYEEEEETSKVRSSLARLQEEHLQVTSSLTAALTSSQEELEAERSLWNQEKLNIQESLRAAIQAADEEEEETSKVRSSLAQLQEEHLQVTSSLIAALTRFQGELEAERSLWNQEKLKLEEYLRAAWAVDEEAGYKPKKKSFFKRFRKFLCCSGEI
ncbi:unnamed protein product [Pleuronectes platessa]|uniref:Uncharacterized protein n=1 Tax=Pleuronectes platessa TaxID=8262 RepID=A0A9N7VZD3_PLEPL|nr:unnamed protein product [Pleuronectes platessa]